MNTLKETEMRTDCPEKIHKPRKTIVPSAEGLLWGETTEYSYQEKLDGRFETRLVRGNLDDLGDTLLAGEYVRGEFYAFDILRLRGEDCRHWPLCDRFMYLDDVFPAEPMDCTGGIIRRVQSAKDGGAFLAEILARGGEGIVRKRLDSPWGTTMEACKRLETFTCVVTGFNAGQSVQISLADRPCGNVALLGGKCDRVRVGSIIKVEGFGLTIAGKIREPRPCKDTPTSWLISY